VHATLILVDSVYPLYGPVAGGTRVTITGQLLSLSSVKAVYFGYNRGNLDTNRLGLYGPVFSIVLDVSSDDL